MPVDAVILLFLILFTPLVSFGIMLRWCWVKLARRRGAVSRESRFPVERRWVILPAAGFLLVYLLCFLWGSLIEPNLVEVTHTEIRVRQPVLGHERFRIVHLSDLHLEGEGTRERKMLSAVAREKPHIILMTGDYLNTAQAAGTLSKILRLLDAPYGVYGVPGNWDRKFEIRSIFEATASQRGNSWPLLLDEDYKLLTRNGRKLLLVGMGTTPHRTLSELLERSSPGAYRIFLAHMPAAVDEVTAMPSDDRVNLFLCGHTHGGQVRLPLWGAVLTFSKYHKQFEMGLYQVGKTVMYVNRGIGMEGGFVPRVRFMCRPEVAVIDLVYEP